MRSRCGWALPALLCLSLTPAPLPAADDVKRKEAKDEARSSAWKLDYRFLSDVSEVEPNDAPAQATLLGCGNTLRPAEIAVQAVRDTDWISFTANAGDVITFGTDADGPSPVGDTRIGVVSDDGSTVLATDDDGGPLAYSLVSLCAPYTGTYYGRIAAFSSQTGSYMAFLTCAPSGAPNDRCAGAIPLVCGPIDLSGTTANACPDYTLPEAGCTGFLANGRDVVYRLDVLAGDSLIIDYSQSASDASIYIVTDCADPAGTCVAGEDSTLVGGHETLSHVFGADGTYYLILDSFSPGSGGPWTATGRVTCVPDRVDTLANAHADLELEGPWGVETIGLNGTALLHATTRGLRDADFDGREQLPIGLAGLELGGNSLNVGPVTLRLRPAAAHPLASSLGEVEELVNGTPGVLDLPPFTPGGTASAQLHAYFEIDLPLLKALLHHDAALPLSPPVLTQYPPAPGETFFSQGGAPLLGSNEAPSAYQIAALKLTLHPAASIDTLPNTRMTLDLLGPQGLETITLKGATVYRAALGNAADSDGDGLEQVEAAIDSIVLGGVSLRYGPIQLSLGPPVPHPLPATTGEIEENVNQTGGQLDVPPAPWQGTAASHLDFFFSVDVGGARYHNHVAKQLTATLTSVPPNPDDVYRNFVSTTLLGDDDSPSPFQARRMFLMLFDVKPDSTQVDSFPESQLVLDVLGPGGFDQVVMHGGSRIETYLGSVHDGDDDGKEQMGTRLTDLEFTAPGSWRGNLPGPITLHMLDTLGLGEIEENAGYTPGMLDLPPFTPVGDATGNFFEVLFEVEIPGYPTLRVMKPSLLEATLHRVPVEGADTYIGSGDNPLVDPAEQPSGLTIVAIRFTPLWGGVVDVPDAPLPRALAIQEIRPNPTSGSASVTLALPRAGAARVAAYDVNGRRVRTLWDGALEAGVRTLAWDGTTDRGDRVPGGIYFVRLECGGQIAARRLAILR